MRKRSIRNRRLWEDARELAGYTAPFGQQQDNTQSSPFGNNTQQQNTDEMDDNQEQKTTQIQDLDDEENKAPFTAEDVANMTPGEIINYVYVNVPEGIDSKTKGALLARADQLRKDADAGGDIEERAKQILRSVRSTINISN